MRISDWSSDVCSSDLLTIDKEAAVRCLFMPAGYERGATSTIGGTDDMRCVRVREIPRRGQPVSYRHTGFAEPLGQVAGVFGVQRSGEERAYVGRPGVELAGERARIVDRKSTRRKSSH